ncbi:hypothetical protein LPTSP4_24160 [Leptospira ryugenii]|uniref:Uncharacterized protein n=1 Tax=Leptospira ryugenii TaxID=1917863 RepID=A0A2P2E213_9LEPT|nr:hypothetical protein [Leptospira ryugenii]GBF50889.1 hypothetical protein LPTSP4_24160 [Leptospira ryugenii]
MLLFVAWKQPRIQELTVGFEALELKRAVVVATLHSPEASLVVQSVFWQFNTQVWPLCDIWLKAELVRIVLHWLVYVSSETEGAASPKAVSGANRHSFRFLDAFTQAPVGSLGALTSAIQRVV